MGARGANTLLCAGPGSLHGEPAESGAGKGAPRDPSCQTGVGTAPAGLLQSSRGSEHPLSNCLELGQWRGWAKTLLVMAWGLLSIGASVSPPGVMRVWLRCTGVSPSGPAHHGPPFLLPRRATEHPRRAAQPYLVSTGHTAQLDVGEEVCGGFRLQSPCLNRAGGGGGLQSQRS